MANVIIDKTTTTDLLALGPGSYRYGGNCANVPSSEPGYMLRFERDSTTGCAAAITHSGRMFSNVLNSGTWIGWTEFAPQSLWTVENKTGSSSKTVTAGASTSFTIDVSKAGYTPKGIIGVAGSGTSSFALQEYTISGTNASVYYANITSQEKTISNVRVTVLYMKN